MSKDQKCMEKKGMGSRRGKVGRATKCMAPIYRPNNVGCRRQKSTTRLEGVHLISFTLGNSSPKKRVKNVKNAVAFAKDTSS